MKTKPLVERKSKILIFLVGAFLVLSEIAFTQCLSGAYTIGGATPNYATVNAAVSDLVSKGVCGQVIFNIRSGTYREQVTIPQITGVSSLNTIIFQSESGDSTSVILCDSSTTSPTNFLVYLNGADYITFKKITLQALGLNYALVVKCATNSNNNQFFNNRIMGQLTASTTGDFMLVYAGSSINKYNIFKNNVFQNGSYGVYYTAPSASSLDSGTVIQNNIFINQSLYAMYLQYHNAPQIISNTISSNSIYSAYYGIYLNNCNNALRVFKNNITGITGYGISLNSCNGVSVPNTGLVANNMVQIGGVSSDNGIQLFSTSYQN